MAEGRPIGIWDRVVRAAILLAIPVIVIAASAAVWANHVHGTDGILAVVLAALVCLTGGCLSLAMLGLFQQNGSDPGNSGGRSISDGVSIIPWNRTLAECASSSCGRFPLRHAFLRNCARSRNTPRGANRQQRATRTRSI